MIITPYRQTLTHSCLAACFLMLLKAQKDIDFDEKTEQDLCMRGSRRIYPFHVVGIPFECAKEYHTDIHVIADNKYFTGILKKAFARQKKISVEHTPITILHIKKLLKKQPLICHIDDHLLGDFSHASHFIVLEKELPGERVLCIDPWTGKPKRLSFSKLEESIHSLKTHIKMCPLVMTLK